jgi:hypothetical protein
LRGYPDAALGTKMILLLQMGNVVVTGYTVALVNPYGRVADWALGHEGPPERPACHLDIKYFLESLCPGKSP